MYRQPAAVPVIGTLAQQIERKHEIIRIYESSIIFDTIAPNQGGIAYE